MRCLRSLSWGVAAFLLTVWSGLAFGQTVVPDYYFVAVSITSGAPGRSGTPEGSCIKLAVNVPGYTYVRTSITSATAGRCWGTNPAFNGGLESRFGDTSRYQCTAALPYFNGTTCVSTKPSTDPADDPNLCTDKNPFVRRWNYPASGPYSAPTNFGGCVVTPIEMMVCRKSDPGSYCMWMVKRTGEKFTGADVTGAAGVDSPEVKADPPVKSPAIEAPAKPDDPTKGPCPAGTVHAGMSQTGIPMCIGTGSTPPPKAPQPKIETEKNETGADGSTTNTKTVTTTNTDGSTTKTVTVTVTKADGTKQTSGTADTSATPSGAAGKSDGDPADDKYDLCKTNPNLSVCREGSVTGKCGEIQCVGDAVQCATLRAAAAMECRGKADEDALKASPQTALGNSILSGADPMKSQIDQALKGTEVDLSKPGLDDTGFLSGGSCLPNKTMTVMGRSVTVEFTELCTNIQPLRGVVMACAFILAYMIVSRSVLQG